MNARQKAKRYKKLYEEALHRSALVEYQTKDLKHYRIRKRIDFMDLIYVRSDEGAVRAYIENGILNEMRPFVTENLIAEKDEFDDGVIYTFDFWVRPGKGG